MLTDAKIRAARPTERPYKLADGRGLTLIVQPTGARWWRFRYRWMGKEKMLSLGTYPDVPLSLARERRDDARRTLAAGSDPGEQRRTEKAKRSSTLRAVAEEWLGKQPYREATQAKVRWILDELLYPTLGDEPITAINAAKALRALRAIEARGHLESAHRARQKLGQILRYAAAEHGVRDITVDLKGALAPVQTESLGAITEPKAFGQLLSALDGYHGQYVTRQYLRILARVVTRPSELRLAQWSEIDFERGLLIVPAERMKMKLEHVVPLSTQVLEMLDEMRLLTGASGLVFNGLRRGRPISDAAPSLALKSLGYDSRTHTAHGFRSTFSTLMHERGEASAVIELCLAHADLNTVRAIYNRAERLEERRALMQTWADYCDELRGCASIQASNSLERHATV